MLNTVHYEELSLWRIIFFILKSCIFQKILFFKWIFENIRKIYVWLMTVLSYKHTCSEILCCSLLEIELIVCHLLVLKNRSTRFVQHQYNKHHTPLLSQLFHFSLTPELCVKFKLFLNKLAGREIFVYFEYYELEIGNWSQIPSLISVLSSRPSFNCSVTRIC